MKWLLVMVIALVAIVAAEEEWKPTIDKDTLRHSHEDCIKESGITTEQLQKIRDSQHPDEKEVHEYILCGVKKLGVFTEENGYNLDRLMSQLDVMIIDAEKLREAVANCVESNKENSTPALRAFGLLPCLMSGKVGDSLRANKKVA